MTPTAMLVLATAAFLATHFVSATPLRPALVHAMGEWPYRGLYSLVALVTLGWMIWAYPAAPREALFPGFREISHVLMPLAFVFLACGFSRNPTIVGADKLLKSEDPARGVIRITRHPIMWAFMLWAAAHIVAVPSARALIFFGAMLLLAAIGTLFMDARKRANPDWARFAAVTSHVPFQAVVEKRNRIVWREIGWLRPLLGLIAFVLLFFVHPWLFGVAAAQGKQTKILVGFPPGGANDLIARIVAAKMGESLGQAVIVENRPGASGLIAAEALAKSPPDGATLMLGSTGTQTMAPHLTRNLPYDALKALAPVSQVGSTPNALAVRPDLKAQSLDELIALARSRPGLLTFASSGNGTTLHLAGVLFSQSAGVQLVHVSYKGNAQALNDVMGGQVDMIFSALPPLLPLAKAGKVRILGVSALERHRGAPEVPTLDELGLRGYESGTWYGVFANGGTPAATLEQLAREVRKAVEDPKSREALLGQGVEPKASTPQEFATLFRGEYERWGKVIRDAGIKAD